jgi:protein-tyrosine phosphatase
MFNHKAGLRGLSERYEVDSAGTSGWHIGESPDPRMRQVAARHGLKYDGRARQFEGRDFERFDLVIAMDDSNRARLEELAGSEQERQKIYLLRAFDPQGSPDEPVPDPYYGGIDGFERTYDIVERSCARLLDALEEGELAP